MIFTLESDEHVILIARRHWFKPALETLVLGFSLLAPLLVSSIVLSVPEISQSIDNPAILIIILTLGWFFVVWNMIFVIWTNHFLDVMVLTNLHVIDIEQVRLWNREISTLNLEKIQDISSKSDGIIAHFLDYGDLEIQTAGSITNFIVKNIQRPDALRQKINERINERLDTLRL